MGREKLEPKTANNFAKLPILLLGLRVSPAHKSSESSQFISVRSTSLAASVARSLASPGQPGELLIGGVVIYGQFPCVLLSGRHFNISTMLLLL